MYFSCFQAKKWLATSPIASLYVISPLPQGAQDRFLRRFRYVKSLSWKLHSKPDIGVYKHVIALNTQHFSALNTGILTFLPCQSYRPRKVDLDLMPLIGAVRGIEMYTPPLLTLTLLPLKNLLASGSQTLTGQASSERASLRCSITVVSIFPFSVNLVNFMAMKRYR